METLNWTKLSTTLNSKTKAVSYEENKHLFVKIAFDVFQLNTSPTESLWILESDSDGKQYLVATYDESDNDSKLEAKGSCWMALADKDNKNVTLLYKNIPIQRFASENFGFNESDIHIFQRTLVEKISEDKSFVSKLIESQPIEKQEIILKQFPELV